MPTKKHKSLSDKGVTNCIWNSHQGLWLQRVDPFIYYPIVQERLCTYPRPSPQCHEDTPNRNHKESKDKPVDVIIMIIKCILESRSSIHHVSPSCVQHTLPKDLCMMQISKDLQRISIAKQNRYHKYMLKKVGGYSHFQWTLTLGLPVLPLVYRRNKVSSASTHSTAHSFEHKGTTSCI